MGEAARLRQFRVGEQLRDLRIEAGMTTRSVASALGLSTASVNRTENGQRPPGRDEVNALCALYRVTGEEKLLLVQRATTTDDSSAWLETTFEERDQVDSLTVLEREALAITKVEVTYVPGLAQTADYARLLIDGLDLADDPEHHVSVRLGRQSTLSRSDEPEITFFMDEGVLHRTLGNPRVVRDQLDHLLIVQRRPNVGLHVLPFSAPPHPALEGRFSLYELPDGAVHVFVESKFFGLFLTEQSDETPYVEARSDIERNALDQDTSVGLIREAVGRLDDV